MSNEPGGRKRSAAELAENDKEEIARLRELLAASNQQREQLAARSRQQEQQLAASNQQREQLAARSRQQEQQLAASNQQREQLAARIRHFEDNSIYALLERETSGSKEKDLFTFKCQGNDASHTTSNSHRVSDTDGVEFILEPVTGTEDMKGQTSMLMTKLDRCGGIIQYQSEADISMYTSLALDDAIKMVSLIKNICLDSRHEQSIFSHRPDHVVVYDVMSNLPVIAVEVKKPAPGGILTRKTAGQVFDYAVSMQAFGHKAPFVVLTSVEETHVTWLDESLPRDLAAGSGRVEAVSMNRLSPSMERSAQAVEDDGPFSLSPPNLVYGNISPQAQISIRSQAPSGSQQLMFKADAERKFCRSSSVYNSSQLTRVLYSVILCGLQGLDRSATKTITRFTRPSACDTRRCLELSEDSYGWGTISSNQKHYTQLKKPSKKEEPSNKKYYVVGIIGSGNTSKVFHALDLDCKEYAIKMYVKRFDGDTYLKKKDFEKKARLSVITEVENFKLIYPELNVVYKKLNKHHCIVMPFFDPIPKDERESRIEDIQNVLEVFASKNLKYKDEDVRWRHVGLHEGKCMLYDLAELEASTSNSFVARHVEDLKKRASLVPHSSGQTFSRGK
jgi:hypothetical protein